MAIITVTELNRYVKRMIDCDPVLGRIMVKGELSNCKLHYSGHLYFALKDESSVVRGVMFKSSVSCLHFHPENGQKVIISGKISVYERDGQYQFYVDRMLLLVVRRAEKYPRFQAFELGTGDFM